MKSVLINADDLGLHSSVNEAVCELAHLGRLNAASFMSYGHIDAAQQQRLDEYGIAIGLHLDLTSDLPRPGHVLRTQALPRWIVQTGFRQLDAAAMRHAVADQLEHFERIWRRAPFFVDGHEHVHQFAQIRAAIAAAWREVFGDAPLRQRLTRPLQNTLKAQVIYRLGGRALAKEPLLLNEFFAGVYDFSDKTPLLALWDNWLERAPDSGLMIMCHPALPSSWTDAIAPARVREYDFLKSAAFTQLLRQHDIALPILTR